MKNKVNELLVRGFNPQQGWIKGTYITMNGQSFVMIFVDVFGNKQVQSIPVDSSSVGRTMNFFDAGGNELFEGDIVVADYFWDNHEFTGICSYLNGEKCIELYTDTAHAMPISYFRNIRLIGNVYSDKELAKNVKGED